MCVIVCFIVCVAVCYYCVLLCAGHRSEGGAAPGDGSSRFTHSCGVLPAAGQTADGGKTRQERGTFRPGLTNTHVNNKDELICEERHVWSVSDQ